MFEIGETGTERVRATFTRRAVFVGVLQVAGLGAIAARLYQLQVLNERQYGDLADANRTNRQALAPLRGRIYDRYGQLLAGTEEFYQAVLIPSLAGDVDQVVARLRRIKALSDEELAEVARLIKTQSASAPIVVTRGLTWKELSAINLNAPHGSAAVIGPLAADLGINAG